MKFGHFSILPLLSAFDAARGMRPCVGCQSASTMKVMTDDTPILPTMIKSDARLKSFVCHP